MEAKTQYNDFVGTAAADISDAFINSIDEYLHYKSPKYDKNQYHCIGCELRPYGQNKLDALYICKDLRSGEVVPMRFNNEFELNELLVMFKRLSIVIGENIGGVQDPECEPVMID